jgi:hypothetical protein
VLNATGEINPEKSNWFQETPVPPAVIEWRWLVATVAEGTRKPNNYVQTLHAAIRAVAALGSHC